MVDVEAIAHQVVKHLIAIGAQALEILADCALAVSCLFQAVQGFSGSEDPINEESGCRGEQRGKEPRHWRPGSEVAQPLLYCCHAEQGSDDQRCDHSIADQLQAL